MSALKAVFFDLDDTLLGNKTDVFMEAYLKLMDAYMAGQPYADAVIPALLAGARETVKSTDTAVSNEEVIWGVITKTLGENSKEVRARFDRFYAEEFSKIQSVTTFRPEAREIMDYCFGQGLTVVVATNPLFPRVAIEERLRWAGVPVSEFAYARVTTLENSTTTKPHTSYYEQICEEVGVEPAECLMVGDSWVNDMEPAMALGMRSFWIGDEEKGSDGFGMLENCLDFLRGCTT